MEHRWTQRIPISLDVRIHRYTPHSYPSYQCLSKDICIDGLRLYCGPLVFSRNESIDIEFTLVHAGCGKCFRLKTLVVDVADQEAGLMFVNPDPVLVDMIDTIVRAQTCVSGFSRRAVNNGDN